MTHAAVAELAFAEIKSLDKDAFTGRSQHWCRAHGRLALLLLLLLLVVGDAATAELLLSRVQFAL